MPLVTGGGLTQHYEKFTQNEFWVTPYNPAQFAAKNLPTYVAGAPSVANRDIVVWYKGSLHHHPRDEDGVYNSSHVWVGTADVMWTGFMLTPHDFFDCSPFYKPCP
jgi:Cu2+-containing amine oxidase